MKRVVKASINDEVASDGIDQQAVVDYCFNHVKSDAEVHELEIDGVDHEFEDLEKSLIKRIRECVEQAKQEFVAYYF